MRELKFRAWNKLTEQMVKDEHVMFDTDGSIEVGGYSTIDEEGGSIIVMQYTGLKDKKDVEIYEGDIVEFVRPLWDYDPDAPTQKLRMVLNQPTLLDVLRQADAVQDGEVIGNIYENKELLK
jgi:uncharacterized phage protein (TIGR01671 family)